MKALILIFFGMLLLVSISFAIDISGDVSGVWSPDNNPYNVTADIRVPQGLSLVIQPGCRIVFQGQYKLTVDTLATLQVMGNVSDSILFTAHDTLTGWLGIRLEGSGQYSQFRYCKFAYCMNAPPYHTQVYCINSSHSYLDIKNCIFTHCGMGTNAGLILSFEDSMAIIDSCLFVNDTTFYELIFGESNNLTISNCLFENTKSSIILFNSYGDSVVMAGNVIRNNTGSIFINDWGHNFIFSINLVVDNIWISEFDHFFIAVDGSTTMENNTICSNNAPGRNLIMLDDEHGYPYLYFKNNIVWGNSVAGSMTFGGEAPYRITYNDIQGGWPGIGNIDIDPKFVYPDTGNFNLSWANWPVSDTSKSPCIDTGDPSSPLDPDSTRADMGVFFYNQRWNDIDHPQIATARFDLLDNYPNPFNSSTTIRYTIPTAGPVMLDIYDILGRKVQTLLDINQPAGEYQAVWQADKVASGMYFYRIQAGDKVVCKPMILLK